MNLTVPWNLGIGKGSSQLKACFKNILVCALMGVLKLYIHLSSFVIMHSTCPCDEVIHIMDLLQESSPHERAIKRDLNRTFPEHPFFKERDGLGQESLLNVLKAYSMHDKEVGYCQGSPFIVGLLLMQV